MVHSHDPLPLTATTRLNARGKKASTPILAIEVDILCAPSLHTLPQSGGLHGRLRSVVSHCCTPPTCWSQAEIAQYPLLMHTSSADVRFLNGIFLKAASDRQNIQKAPVLSFTPQAGAAPLGLENKKLPLFGLPAQLDFLLSLRIHLLTDRPSEAHVSPVFSTSFGLLSWIF